MVTICFIEHDGTRHEVEVSAGTNLMAAAVDNDVPGIDGDCGGNCACATCHIYVDEAWSGLVGGPASQTEVDLLGFTDMANGRSRLACQVAISEALDGLVVRLPLGQH